MPGLVGQQGTEGRQGEKGEPGFVPPLNIRNGEKGNPGKTLKYIKLSEDGVFTDLQYF